MLRCKAGVKGTVYTHTHIHTHTDPDVLSMEECVEALKGGCVCLCVDTQVDTVLTETITVEYVFRAQL